MRNRNGRNASANSPSTFARGNNRLVKSGLVPSSRPSVTNACRLAIALIDALLAGIVVSARAAFGFA